MLASRRSAATGCRAFCAWRRKRSLNAKIGSGANVLPAFDMAYSVSGVRSVGGVVTTLGGPPVLLTGHVMCNTHCTMKSGLKARRYVDPVRTMRLPDDLTALIDRWRNTQVDKPSRSEAIRRLVLMALASTSDRLGRRHRRERTCTRLQVSSIEVP